MCATHTQLVRNVAEGNQRVERLCVYLNYREYAEQWGALVLIHRSWSNKAKAFEELVGVCTWRNTWGV